MIGNGGVGDALAPGRALAPGAYIAIYGQNLTSGSTWAATGPALPLKRMGTLVLVNGTPIPLLYASPGQVNARLPGTLTPGQAAVLQVWMGGRMSNAVELW